MLYAFDCLSMNSWSWFATTNVCLIVALQWIAAAFQMSDFVLSKRVVMLDVLFQTFASSKTLPMWCKPFEPEP